MNKYETTKAAETLAELHNNRHSESIGTNAAEEQTTTPATLEAGDILEAVRDRLDEEPQTKMSIKVIKKRKINGITAYFIQYNIDGNLSSFWRFWNEVPPICRKKENLGKTLYIKGV